MRDVVTVLRVYTTIKDGKAGWAALATRSQETCPVGMLTFLRVKGANRDAGTACGSTHFPAICPAQSPFARGDCGIYYYDLEVTACVLNHPVSF